MSLLTRTLSIAGTLVTIPIVVNYLGPEQYGLWTTLTTVFIYLKLADGGVTIGLIPLVAHAHGADDTLRVRALLSSAFAVTVGVALLVLLPLAFAVRFLDWRWLLGLSDPALRSEATAVTAIIIMATAVGYPAGVIRQGRAGLQQGAEANAWDLLGTIVTFSGQIAAVWLKLGLVALATVTAATPVFINALSSIAFLISKGEEYRPRFKLATWTTARTLFASGSVFLGLTLAQALAVQMDQVLIAKILGVGAVTDYSIVQKLFAQPFAIVTMYLAAQFPAYGEALTRGDHDWIRRHFRWTLFVATFFSIVTCAMIALLIHPILRFWIGGEVQPAPVLVVSMAAYGVISAIANVLTYFFFALSRYRPVIIAHVGMIAINLSLSVALIPKVGSAGAIIATSFGYVVALIIPIAFAVAGVLNHLPGLRTRALADKGTID